MDLNQLLNDLAHHGIKLSLEGEQLSIRAPSGALTPDLRRRLADNKASLLALLRQSSRRQEPDARPSFVPAPENKHLPFPLTDIQQAYWIGRSGSMEMGNVGCHVYWEFDSSGLDLERLSHAWQRLLARHDMLRAIITPDGQQRILSEVPTYTPQVHDLRGQEPGAVQARLEEMRSAMSHRVYVPEQWPLFDIQAALLGEQRTRLFVSFDMLIMDGASIQQILDEWRQLYEAPITEFPPLEPSFRDCVLAEAALKGSEEYRRSEAYWFSRLATLPLAPELPVLPLPAGQQARFVRRTSQLEAAAWERLKARALRAGLTPSGLLCAAYAEVLGAWSSSPHFSIALTMFRRPPLHPQVNAIIGDFTSTLILAREEVPETFEARAGCLQRRLDQDLEHPHVSGVHLIRELNRTQRGMVSNGIPVVFTSLLGHRQEDTFQLGWLGEIAYGVSQTPQVWLDFQTWIDQGGLVLNWDALEAVFPEGLLDDMFAALRQLLHRLAWEDASWQEPSWRLVPVPSAQLEQRARVNATEAPVSNELLHLPFAARARQSPERVAVISPRGTLTYGELARRASQIGRLLREHGARPGQLVAVVMEKGWEQVAAVLGILASGAAYLPVDASVPTERLHHLLAHGQVQLVLTQTWLQERLSWPDMIRRFSVDDDSVWAPYDSSPLEPVQGPDDLAYVIYTSGSTGLPKGVVIDHRGAVNTILDVNQRFGVGPEDRTLALSSLNFDLSVYDIFGLLAVGGAIVFPEESRRRDPAYWSELVKRERVSIWNSVPALMEMWVDHLAEHSAELPASMRLVLMSGDWIPVTLPERIRELRHEGAQLDIISLGGATEASIWSILYPIGQVPPEWKSIPYGWPMVNQRFHVLGESLEDRPVWVPGHLYIGGIGLAKGYWRDEEKTRASFIVHPRTGERLYRTGDLGRYLPDGSIEFLGRNDGQVKIGGHRIELGEVESALVQHPSVQHVVVVAKGQPRGNRRLVAYVVPKQQQETPPPLEGVITDPGERIEFKLKKPGLRRDEEGRTTIPLGMPPTGEQAGQTYAQRRSYRHFDEEALSLERLSGVLSFLREMEVDGRSRRYYGSAGSLYPVQVYLYVKPDRVEGLEGGTYYYHPVKHQLVVLSREARIESSAIHYGENREIAERSAFSLFLIGKLQAIAPLYGAYARDFCMLEAGYLSQLLMMAAPTQQMGFCPIGMLDFDALKHLFVLDEDHVFLHCHVGGSIARAVEHATVPAASTNKLGQSLREFLLSKLPDYMVPSLYLQMEALPLTANGKVDRKALSAREDVLESQDAPFVEPQGELEERLAAIARDVFKVEKIGAEQNFFELGGTSIHMIQLANRVRDTLGRAVAVTDVFRSPNLRALAASLEQGQDASASLQETKSRVEARRASRMRRRGG